MNSSTKESEDVNDQVLSIVADINKCNSEMIPSDVNTSTKPKLNSANIPKGKPKSGRFWKSSRERFSSINKTKGLKPDFQAKTALRLELQHTKALANQALEQIKQKKLAQKERRRENIRKTEENRKKSEIVQVITNTAKLKKMKKKQLRFIQKRDTNNEVQNNK